QIRHRNHVRRRRYGFRRRHRKDRVMGYRIGIDVGGTFTDFLVVEPDGRFDLWKHRTTPEDQSIGVVEGIREIADKRGLTLKEFLGRTDLIIHGTTTADNTMIELTGAKTSL